MDNYTGPYWSDGKLQSSVEFGQSAPLSALDAESRLHDSAYKHYEDLEHRMAADAIYDSRVEKLGGLAKFAGMAALYGNQTLRAGSNLADYAKYGPLGLVVGSLINDYHLNDYMMNVDKYKKEILAYYDTDPGWAGRGETPSSEPKRVVRRFAGGDDSSDIGMGKIVDYAKPGVYSTNNGTSSSTVYSGLGVESPQPTNMYPAHYRRGGRRRKRRVRYG